MSEEISLVGNQYVVSLDLNAMVEAGVNKTSTPTLSRAKDIKNNKSSWFLFFDFDKKSLEVVLPQDIIGWRNEMQEAEFSTGTTYNSMSALAITTCI